MKIILNCPYCDESHQLLEKGAGYAGEAYQITLSYVCKNCINVVNVRVEYNTRSIFEEMRAKMLGEK